LKFSVLVTGAGGMIGRCLIPVLTSNGHNVVAVVRKPCEYESLKMPDVYIIEGDLKDENICNKAMETISHNKADWKAVVHLAGIKDVAFSKLNPVSLVSNNVSVTAKLLFAATTYKIKRFVFASTTLVYGRQDVEPVTETCMPFPRSIYAATKLAAEALVSGFAAEHEMSSEIARISNIYGPESPENTVVGKVISQIRRGDKVEVLSRTPVRDFVFINDVIESLYRLLITTVTPGCKITNISSGTGTSIGKIVDTALQIAGIRPNILDEQNTDDRLVFSNELLKIRTGWSPRRSIHEGLSLCLSHFNKGLH
jgi:UDP-glucose 4-epimerase